MASFNVYDGTAYRTASGVWVYDGTAYRSAKGVWVYDGTQYRQVFGALVPPSAVPTNPVCTDTSFCDTMVPNYAAGASWTNTDTTNSIDVEWTVNGAVTATHALAHGSASDSYPNPNVGDSALTNADVVQFRVRYRNAGGGGTWSAYSNPVTIANPC